MVDRNLNRLFQTTQNLRRFSYGPRPATIVQVREAIEQAGGGKVTISDTAPALPEPGDLWWDSADTTQLYVYYQDPTGPAQWVVANSGLPATGGGGPGGGIPEAPADSVAYGRENGGWTPVLALSGDILDGGNF